jgi:hypothetical protein
MRRAGQGSRLGEQREGAHPTRERRILIAIQEELITASTKDIAKTARHVGELQGKKVHIDLCQVVASTQRTPLPRDYIVPVIPPLTEINCAVIHRLFSDTSRSVASARSSGVPRRFAARVPSYMASCIAVGDPSGATRYSRDMSVGTGPGASVLTVIPWLLPSCPAYRQIK